ncbi:Mtm1p [Ascoidea rubescens DSM 1968]|uniref:Mitochondrial protein of the mitochondrial carrier family n=1 Tax=Ascoidea rubescens DSM 1968 TaxID=1344418 RepID=A0A1D2VGF1_9ASCO|nr:mitochondrial protein of the mitochondrial carrier family [Ascoidea rubescens DSM 1968]ODV60620.1 mitochondrial protein of the mitochondrial carrier family [Ascoidea rubescens DSM 1968]
MLDYKKDLLPALKQDTPSVSPTLTVSQRMLSACTGSLLTCMILTPFDVVRIRLQQQHLISLSALVDCGLPKHVCCQHKTLFWQSSNSSIKDYCSSYFAVRQSKLNGTFDAFNYIYKNEGLLSLWRGISLALIISVPANIIYFTGYEYLRDHSPLKDRYPSINPLISGAFARTLAVSIISPMELLKTKLQAIPSRSNQSAVNNNLLKDLLSDTYSSVQKNGIKSLFRGLELTLFRDVPFSAVYWFSYEFSKKRLSNLDYFKKNDTNETVFIRSFLCGSISGTIAAFFTNPFDVGKTRLQVSVDEDFNLKNSTNPLVRKYQNPNIILKKESMFKYLSNIVKDEGFSALYIGLIPRVLKIAPSCAIMISTYEISKKFFGNKQSH